jgi:hypothetical protein
MKMEQTECFETSAYKIQTPANYPEENIQDRQCTCKCNMEARSRNHCGHGKAINITHSECISVTLVMQHAKRMRRVVLLSVVCLAVTL